MQKSVLKMFSEYGACFSNDRSKCVGSALVKASDISLTHTTAMVTDFKSVMTERKQLTSLPCDQLRYEAPVLENKEAILCLVSATMVIRSGKPQKLRKTWSFTISSIIKSHRFELKALQYETSVKESLGYGMAYCAKWYATYFAPILCVILPFKLAGWVAQSV